MRPVLLAVLIPALSLIGFGHTIPDDVTVQAFAKSEAGHFHLLIRVPFNALADTVFPLKENGALDLKQVQPMLPGVARIWIAEWTDLYSGGELLPKPLVKSARIAPVTDRSFVSSEGAWNHLTGPPLAPDAAVFPDRALFDVLLEWPIANGKEDFAIHSRLARLGGRVVTGLRYIPPHAPPLTFGFAGDPGLFALSPRWYQSLSRFAPLGLLEILSGGEYLLFLLCLALRLRRFSQLLPAAAAFSVGMAATLVAASFGFAPEGLWFPVAFETVIAASLVYLALENIWPSSCVLLWPLFGFGLAHGFGLALSLRPVLQFGGTHGLASVLSFTLGAAIGAFAVIALSNRMLHLIFRAGVPERVGTIFLSGIVAHTGWHRMLDRAKWLGTFSWPWPQLNISSFAMSPLLGLAGLALGLAAVYYFVKRDPVTK